MSKQKCRYVLGVDPSGNFKEGNGTTGVALYDREKDAIIAVGSTQAHDYDSWELYFYDTWKLIWYSVRHFRDDCVIVVEDYLLYASKSNAQINSLLETPRMIGYLCMCMWYHSLPYHMQRAVDVKNRWTDEILEHKGYIERKGQNKTYEHCHGQSPYRIPCEPDLPLLSHHIDAIRHAVHYGKFGKE